MTLIDRQIEVIAGACAVTTATVRAVIAGERVGTGPDERVRAALSLIGFVPPLPRPSTNLDLFVNPVDQAVLAMRYNGNGPECLPHLACGGIGCDDCIGGARRCGMCVRRVAVKVVADGTPDGMPVCGWCADDAKTEWQHGPSCGCNFDSASLCPKRVRVRTRPIERAERFRELDRPRRKDTGDETLSVVSRGHGHCISTGNCGDETCPVPSKRPGAFRRFVGAILERV